MTSPNDNVPMTKEERVKEDYFGMEKEYWTPFGDEFFEIAAYLSWKQARKEARRVRAEEEETNCLIHGKIGGRGGDCPLC